MADEEEVPPTRRGRLRFGWMLVAALTATTVLAAVILTVQRDDKGPDDFAQNVANAFTQGGEDSIRSVFCESTTERSSAVDVFALVRPIKATVDTVVEEDDSNANALLVVDKTNDRLVVAMEKKPGWCLSELILCTPAAQPTIDPPRVPCDALIGSE